MVAWANTHLHVLLSYISNCYLVHLARRFLAGELTVLIAGSGERAERRRETIAPEVDSRVETVAPAELPDRARKRHVACVVLSADDPRVGPDEEIDPRELATEADTPGTRPELLVHLGELDPDVIAASRSGYVTLVLETDDLPGTTERAVDRYLDRLSDSLAHDALDSLLSGLDRTTFLKDSAGTYLKYDPGSEDTTPSRVLGETETELDDKDAFGTEWDRIDRRVLSSGEPVVDEVLELGADGERFEHAQIPWTDSEGRPLGVIGYRTPVGQRETREPQTERSRTEQLARYLAHDLKNPLVVANGHLELAKETGDESALSRVEEALERMDELIDDLSDVAEGGDVETTVHRTELASVAMSVWDRLTHDEPNVSLEIDTPESALVLARESDLRPLLENLFKNALVHGRTPSEPLTVHVGTTNDGFYVADNGPGIAPDERDRVFEDGYSTGNDRTGTGLAIVEEIADSNGWWVSVTDGESGGARFEFHDCPSIPEPEWEPAAGESLSLTDITDVGSVEQPGSASYDESADAWTVTGDGRDIWHDQNDFTFVHTTVEGPVRIEATVGDIDASGPFSKAGLMLRESTQADASHGYVGQNADRNVELLWRETADGLTSGNHLSGDKPRRMRIDRVGDRLTCSISGPGAQWYAIDQRRIDLDSQVAVGLAVCSTVPNRTSTAVFEDVAVRRLDPGDYSESSSSSS